MRMAADVTRGIHRWLQRRTGTEWGIRLENPIVGRRRPRVLSRYVIASGDSVAPTIAVCESNWSDLTKGRFRRYSIRRWLLNAVASAGAATRDFNRKTQFEVLFILGPLVAVAMAAFALLGFTADTSLRAGAAIIPLLLIVALAFCSFVTSLIVPYAPLVRRRLRILAEELERHSGLPAGMRHVAALFEMSAAPPSDPSNIVLAFISMCRGVVGSAFWLVAAWLYARLVLGPGGSQALTRVTVADALAFVALAFALRFGYGALRHISIVYEPLEDVYSYADPRRKARRRRNKVIRRVTADLQSFLAATPFDAVILTGHSLGSVLLLDALAEIERDVEAERYDSRHLAPVHAIVMYGSPFTKIHTQIRALDPRRFTAELDRSAAVLQWLAREAKLAERAVCHNVYYLTDVIAEKIATGDESIANYKLRSPLRPWSHGSYHEDRSFWTVVFGAAGLVALFEPQPGTSGSEDAAARSAVPSRWPAPTWRNMVVAFAKIGMLALAGRMAVVAVAHGANPNVALLFLLGVIIALVSAVRD